MSCFGIGGARRLAPLCGQGLPGCGNLFGMRNALGRGFTGPTGALESPCVGSCQFVGLQGFRWLQFRDDFEFATSNDGVPGYLAPTDMFYNSNVQNDLLGYQFGGRLNYCLTQRLFANLGAKAGIYGNNVTVDQRLGTPLNAAYVIGDPTQRVDTHSRDVVLAGLGEIDLGLGYRVTNALSINGGYRMLYAGGVATSVNQLPNDYQSIASSPRVYANDSLLLHGAYVGAMLNW